MQSGGVEFSLLSQAARPIPGLAGARKLLRDGVDADLLTLAAQHGVRPLLLRCFAGIDWEGVSADLRQGLEAFHKRHLTRALSLTDELLKSAAALKSAHVPFATFKGPALALELYGGLALREYADIDLVVPVELTEHAEQALAEMGYFSSQGDWAFRQAFLRHQRQYALVREERDAAIDLHWNFSSVALPFPVVAEEIWTTLGATRLGGRTVPILSRENLALLLAGHGTKEAWRRLVWVCDFAMLIEQSPNLDWLSIHRRASAHGCGDAVLLACAMAAGLLETPVPHALKAVVERSCRVRRIAKRLIDRLRTTIPEQVRREPLEDALLCDRLSDRLKAWITLGFTPTPSDYEALPLPPSLWPLYRITRPLRLGVELVVKGLRRCLRMLPAET
jgi:Uncharacterised nucleotidyltransferase